MAQLTFNGVRARTAKPMSTSTSTWCASLPPSNELPSRHWSEDSLVETQSVLHG